MTPRLYWKLSERSGIFCRSVPVWSAVTGAVVGLVAVIPLGSWFGGIGVATAYLIATTLGAAVPLAVVRRRFGLAWTGPAVRSFAVLLIALAVSAAIGASSSYGFGRIVIDILAALALAAVGALVLRRDITKALAARHAL